MKWFTSFLLMMAAAASAAAPRMLAAREWYVSPDAAPFGDGSKSRPLTLQPALTNHQMRPGDVVIVRPGEYRGRFVCNARGVVVRGYGAKIIQPSTRDDERPGLFLAPGSQGVTIEGFEIYAEESRLVDPHGSDYRGVAIDDQGEGNVVAHCCLHDCTQGITSFKHATGSRYIGNVITANGFFREDVKDRPHGHGVYTQNHSDKPKVFQANAVFMNAMACFQVYGQRGELHNIKLVGNTTFAPKYGWDERRGEPKEQYHSIILDGAGDGREVHRHRDFKIGAPEGESGGNIARSNDGEKLVVRDSVFVTGSGTAFEFDWLGPLDVRSNRFVCTDDTRAWAVLLFNHDKTDADRFADNLIFRNPAHHLIKVDGYPTASNDQFLATYPGFGEFRKPPPDEPWVYVERSPIRSDWRLVTIYNWTGESSASVPLDLPSGSYAVKNVQDLRTAIATSDGDSVSLPLNARPVTQPRGAELVADYIPTLPKFGCFIVHATERPW